MSSEKAVLVDEERTLRYGGNSTILSMPPETKQYLKKGEKVRVIAKIKGGAIIIEVIKSLYNFDLNDIRALVKERGFQIKEDKTMGGIIEMFEAKKQNIILNYTKNIVEQISPAYVVLTATWKDLDYGEYVGFTNKVKKLGSTFDVVIRPEGDVDTINVLSNPSRYNMNVTKAFKLLKNKDKKIGLSVTLRFNNAKNTIKEIDLAAKELIQLNS